MRQGWVARELEHARKAPVSAERLAMELATTVAQAIEEARDAAAAQGGTVVLCLTLTSGEHLTIRVQADGRAMLVEAR